MSYFPMFVDLEGKHVLAVGAGTIGSRRILTLLKFGAQVTAVDPNAAPGKGSRFFHGAYGNWKQGDGFAGSFRWKADGSFCERGRRSVSVRFLFPRDCLRRLRDGRSDHRGRRPPAGKTGLRRGESFSDGMGRKLERTGTDCR